MIAIVITSTGDHDAWFAGDMSLTSVRIVLWYLSRCGGTKKTGMDLWAILTDRSTIEAGNWRSSRVPQPSPAC